jgi:hypothetical protein
LTVERIDVPDWWESGGEIFAQMALFDQLNKSDTYNSKLKSYFPKTADGNQYGNDFDSHM